MKMKRCSAQAWLPVMAFLLVGACSSSNPDPATSLGSMPADGTAMIALVEGVPGGVMADTTEMQATVSAIDKAKRSVTLTGSDGQSITAQVGPEAVNFDQVEVGDTVKLTLAQTLAIYMGDADSSASDGEAVMAAASPVGDKPGVVMAGGMQTTATVKAIDVENHTATLAFADGSTETFPVRPDVDLSKREVGEQVVFELGTMLTIEVVTP